jgi:hypothetical protein
VHAAQEAVEYGKVAVGCRKEGEHCYIKLLWVAARRESIATYQCSSLNYSLLLIKYSAQSIVVKG